MPKRSRPKSKRLSSVKWQKLSDEWETSELRQPAFCKLKGISLNTFIYWRSKKRSQNNIPSKTNFLPAKIKMPAVKQSVTQSITLRLPNGISLQIPLNANKEFLNAVFELLGIASC